MYTGARCITSTMERPAQENTEYILVFDHPVWAKNPSEVLVPKDTLVTVRYKPTGALLQRTILGGTSELEFTVKGTDKTFTTNYGYMFAPHTEENLVKLARFRQARLEAEQAKAKRDALWKDLDTVAGPSEGVFSSQGNHDQRAL